jgi:hypothetical protein
MFVNVRLVLTEGSCEGSPMRIIKGYLISVLSAALFLFAFGQISTWLVVGRLMVPFEYLMIQLIGLAAIMFVIVLPFFAVAAWAGERWRIRHWAYYATCGAATALAIWAPFGWLLYSFPHGGSLWVLTRGALGWMVSAIIGGLAYWFVSGHRAGRDAPGRDVAAP